MRIHLDSVPKYRNVNEWRPVNRATCWPWESIGDGDNLKSIARLMLDAGVVGRVDVYRGETPVFLSVSLEDLAKARVGKDSQPEHLRKTNADTDADLRQ